MRHSILHLSFIRWGFACCLFSGVNQSSNKSAVLASPSAPPATAMVSTIKPPMTTIKLPSTPLRRAGRSSVQTPPSPFVPVDWEKGTCGTVVIKGRLGAVTLSSHPQEQVKIELNGSGQVIRTKYCIIIDSCGTQLATGNVVIPQGMNVIIESGCVNVSLQRMIGALKIHGGHVRVSGDGTITRLAVKAGVADLHINGIIGMTHIQCGQGNVALGYQFEEREVIDSSAIFDPSHVGYVPSKPSASGLSLYTPPVRVCLHIAKGNCHLFFPRQAKVDPGRSDITTTLERCKTKECHFKVAPYTTEDVSISIADTQSFPADHVPPTSSS